MRPTQLFRSVSTPSLFTSAKCRVAVPVDNHLLRCVLEQASLDASVRAIRYRKGPDIQCPPVSATGVILDRVDGTFLLKVYRRRPDRSEEDQARVAYALDCIGLRLLECDEPDIRREPVFSNVRAVWSHRNHHVSLIDRLRIAMALSEHGPQSIAELERRADLSYGLQAVCALACEDLIKLDISERPLGPRTTVLGP